MNAMSNWPPRPIANEGVQGFERGREVEPNLRSHPGLGPVAPGDGRPLFVHVARDELTVLGQGESYAERAVARENPNLDRAPRTDETGQHAHELPLLGAYLHPCLVECGSFFP